MISSKYKVDFSRYVQDFETLAYSRLLYQFKNSELLKRLVYAFIREVQVLYDTIIELMQKRTIYDAYNYNLDAIGRIVGQFREPLDILTDVWFTPDTDDLCADIGLAYVTGGVYYAGSSIPDDFYKLEVLARVFSDMNQYSSVPELQNAIKEVFGINASFVNLSNEPMAVDIYVDRKLTPFERGFFTAAHRNLSVEHAYFLAWPAGLRINSVIEVARKYGHGDYGSGVYGE